VTGVTGVTGGLELFLENQPLVAGLTAEGFVLSTQGKLGVLVVIESQNEPALGAVTFIALRAITSSMLVILLVAIEAGRAEGIFLEISAMTRFAPGLLMIAHKRKFRVTVMIDNHVFPTGGRVAGFTTSPIASAVNVVQPVAGKALHGSVLVALVGMTLIAGDFLVLALEGKLGLIVVELAFPPAVFTMAVTTLPAETALVSIVFLVTGNAFRRCLPILGIVGMTGTTLQP
jgi:hypothetical protein